MATIILTLRLFLRFALAAVPARFPVAAEAATATPVAIGSSADAAAAVVSDVAEDRGASDMLEAFAPIPTPSPAPYPYPVPYPGK